MSASGPPPVPGGRSPEEREAARREREARRAGRNNSHPVDEAVAEPAPAPPPAPVWTEEAEPFQAQAGAGPPPPSRTRRRRLIPALAGGLVALLLAWFLFSLFQPFKGDGEGDVRVVVPKGAGVGEIADLLAEKDVISSSFFFELRATVTGRRGDLKPGPYTLQHDMSNGAALDALADGPPPNIVTITVPEGRSRRESAKIVGGSLEGSYLNATRSSPVLNPASYKAPRGSNLEGFLFPATYELKRGRPVTELVKQQLTAFKQRFAGVDLSYAKRKNLIAYDVLIIASMVEREAQVPKERAIIASVIYNRLHEGMPLGIDATIRFALNQWTEPLTESELATPSPYNTRTNPSLPPGPIGSPGLASIRAAAHPAKTGYLFYVVKPGGNGSHAFSRTDAEFQRDVDRYNQAREAAGGKSPD